MRGFFMAAFRGSDAHSPSLGDGYHKAFICRCYLFTQQSIPTMLNAHHDCAFMERMGMDVLNVEHQGIAAINEGNQMSAEVLA